MRRTGDRRRDGRGEVGLPGGSSPFDGRPSTDLPTRNELTQGTTGEVKQENGDRIVGDVGVVLTDERTKADGILVKLSSGAEGRVKRIGPETRPAGPRRPQQGSVERLLRRADGRRLPG